MWTKKGAMDAVQLDSEPFDVFIDKIATKHWLARLTTVRRPHGTNPAPRYRNLEDTLAIFNEESNHLAEKLAFLKTITVAYAKGDKILRCMRCKE